MKINMFLLTGVFVYTLLFGAQQSFAQKNQDSAELIIKSIGSSYRKGIITEKAYLDSVYLTMRKLLSNNTHLSNKELLNLLQDYRKLIWDTKDNFEYKRQYYGILSNQAQASVRYGEMVYYGEKIDQLEQQYNNRPILTRLTIILDYYMLHVNYNKVIEVYKKNEHYLEKLPALGTSGGLKANELVQSVILLQKVSRAMYELQDIKSGAQVDELADKIIKTTIEKHSDDYNILANINYLKYDILYYKADATKDTKLKLDIFNNMQQLLADSTTPDYLKYYIDITLTDWKVLFFLKNKNSDSAKVYINKYEQLSEDENIPYNLYLFKKTKAQELYNNQNYKAGFEMLQNAAEFLDTARIKLVDDIDEMLYARTKSEEQAVIIKEAEIKNIRTTNMIRYTITVSLLLVLGILFYVWYSRQKQKRRFLEFKLNMARNIHDETGPALLYAKYLAKTYRTDNNEMTRIELEKHLDTTMAAIRGLSHDLKSNELHSVGELVKKTDETLKKLKNVSEFNYKIIDKTGENRFISHYQFSQLKAMLQECITNSIKHSEFDEIKVSFERINNKLTIMYSDNGKGLNTEYSAKGIGMKNMEERSQQINGDLTINNQFPNGYEIKISVNLR